MKFSVTYTQYVETVVDVDPDEIMPGEKAEDVAEEFALEGRGQPTAARV